MLRSGWIYRDQNEEIYTTELMQINVPLNWSELALSSASCPIRRASSTASAEVTAALHVVQRVKLSSIESQYYAAKTSDVTRIVPSVGTGHVPPHCFGHHIAALGSAAVRLVHSLHLQVKLYVSFRTFCRISRGRVTST